MNKFIIAALFLIPLSLQAYDYELKISFDGQPAESVFHALKDISKLKISPAESKAQINYADIIYCAAQEHSYKCSISGINGNLQRKIGESDKIQMSYKLFESLKRYDSRFSLPICQVEATNFSYICTVE